MEARCLNAIDYSKPVAPLLESWIHSRLETKLYIEKARMISTTTISDDSSSLFYPKETNLKKIANELCPWIKQNTESSNKTLQEKAEIWAKYSEILNQ